MCLLVRFPDEFPPVFGLALTKRLKGGLRKFAGEFVNVVLQIQKNKSFYIVRIFIHRVLYNLVD